jgi:hypothetical protein
MKRERAKPVPTDPNPFPEVCPVPATVLETVGPLGTVVLPYAALGLAPSVTHLPPALARRPPEWVANVAESLGRTLLGKLVAWCREDFSWDLVGRFAGSLSRFAGYFEHDLPRLLLGFEGFEIPERRQAEFEAKLTVEPLRPSLVQRLGRPVGADETTADLALESLRQAVERWIELARNLADVASRQQPEEFHAFLAGQVAGYSAVIDVKGNFVGQTPRTETYLELLALWPAIEQLRQRQPPITREELYRWLVGQGVWRNAPGLDWFHDLCDEIRLGTKRRGRPRKQQ